jgi:molybdenum cofactor guanylyltransferase
VTSEGNNIPPLYGLVLAGGRSVRMGSDKGAMQWHGVEQRYYMADLLKEVCEDVYISCRADQKDEMDNNYKTLPDSCPGAGPLIAILSAFRSRPHVAWLVVACDLPLLDRKTLLFLAENRNTRSIATTYRSPFDGLPEPLITIWEPAAFAKLEAHIADGFSCPRKALIRNEGEVTILTPPDEQALINANTPEDAAKARSILGML